MAGSYARLPSIHESQDIVDLHRQPASESDGQIELRDLSDRNSTHSSDTKMSAASHSTGLEKLKTSWNRIRRKPESSKSYEGSIRRHPAAEIEPTRIGRGIWKDQLLVDRSLRTMAFLMTW